MDRPRCSRWSAHKLLRWSCWGVLSKARHPVAMELRLSWWKLFPLNALMRFFQFWIAIAGGIWNHGSVLPSNENRKSLARSWLLSNPSVLNGRHIYKKNCKWRLASSLQWTRHTGPSWWLSHWSQMGIRLHLYYEATNHWCLGTGCKAHLSCTYPVDPTCLGVFELSDFY